MLKKYLAFLKFKFNGKSCILSGNPSFRSPLVPGVSSSQPGQYLFSVLRRMCCLPKKQSSGPCVDPRGASVLLSRSGSTVVVWGGGSHWYSLWSLHLCQFARAAITKDHRLGALNSRNLFSHYFGAWKAKIKVSSGFLRSPSLTCRWPSSLSVLTWSSLCASLCPNLLLYGHQSYWIRAQPSDLILTQLPL